MIEINPPIAQGLVEHIFTQGNNVSKGLLHTGL
jgi:hypothetical protein